MRASIASMSCGRFRGISRAYNGSQMRGLTAGLDPRAPRAVKDTSSTLGTLRATLCAAALALPTTLIPAGPLAAQSTQPPLLVPPVSALPPLGPGGPLVAPDSFD